MALAAGQVFGDYEIVGELGRGGMGTVYLARQKSLQRTVALKILPLHHAEDADLAARFQSEAVAAASLNHPNIVQVFATGEHDCIRFIAMEYVEGESIQQRIRRCGRLPMTEALDIAYHVAVALDAAWQAAQLIHRDVKPDNIFLSANGTVKLGDFGLAKMIREGASSLTITGRTMGSPHFISPEQAHAQRDIDFRADIYSLGCTLHYMLTGRMVFEGNEFLSIVLKHINDEPAPLCAYLQSCPPGVEKLLARMLAKKRDERPQTYATLIEELLHARTEAALWESSDERQRRRMAAPQKTRWRFAAPALLLAVLTCGYFYLKPTGGAYGAAANVTTLADPSDRRDFVEAVHKLDPRDRVERVMEKLREVNPAFSGKRKVVIEDDEVVTELTISTVGVTNLWPLSALPHLRVLRCIGDATNKHRGDLVDLSPVAELIELEELDCSWNPVKILAPLTNILLNTLRCANTRVETLAPLRGLLLNELDVTATAVRELSPLAGAPLAELRCDQTRVRDLSPLKNAPLKAIWCDTRLVSDDLVRTWTQLESINGLPVAQARKGKRIALQ
jgi:serine/threonine protein kinase